LHYVSSQSKNSVALHEELRYYERLATTYGAKRQFGNHSRHIARNLQSMVSHAPSYRAIGGGEVSRTSG